MCTGYAKQTSEWVCKEAQYQRDLAMLAWGQAFDRPDMQAESPKAILPPAPGQTQLTVCSQAKPANFLPRPVGTK